MLSYDEFFKQLTAEGLEKFEPYAFQTNCYENFFLHNSYILNAPTGSGKTWAAITPFIYSWYQWKNSFQSVADYPRKIIYSLPLRTLANSLYQEVKKKININFPELSIKVTLQTGESRYDPFFEGDIIFTTIDQTISSLLSIPLSLSGNLANINAGAVISSYLIFDEFHLLEPKKSLGTILILLDKLKNVTLFCLMTATLSGSFLKKTAEWLNAKVINIKKEDYKNLSFAKSGSSRKIKVQSNYLDSDEVLNNHKNKTIVILNTVDKCVTLFKELIERCKKNKIELICLHSRFFDKDRREKEKKVLKYFDKFSIDENVILITTQIIEVGMDISCDVMLTEISPINSFLQRVGRCARWKGDGQIYLFDCEKTYLPYLKKLSNKTFSELKKINGLSIDYYISQELIESILSKFENNIFSEIQENSKVIWETINNAWRTGDKGFARSLIRDISSISVVLLPKTKKTDSLYKYDSISINPNYLEKKVLDFYNLQDPFEYEPVLLGLKDNFISDDFSDDFTDKELEAIDISELKYQSIVALNSDCVGYSKELGLDFTFQSGINSQKKDVQQNENFIINYDTYDEHINWMMQCFNENYSYQYSLKQIQKNKYSKFDLLRLIKFMIVSHDYGKLNKLWQKIAVKYQENLTGTKIKTNLAHTDFDPGKESHLNCLSQTYKELGVKRKPNHSGVGSFVALDLLPILLKDSSKQCYSISKVVATAILRHHSSFSKNIPAFEISEKSFKSYINKLKEIFTDSEIPEKILHNLYNFRGDDSQRIVISFSENKLYESIMQLGKQTQESF